MKLPLIFLVPISISPLTAQNLLTNSDFEQGNAGFTSQYFFTAATSAQESYAVSMNPRNNNSLFANMADHTSGSGSMLVVNGSTNTDEPYAWRQEVAVLDGASYRFSFWAANLYGSSPSVIDIKINGNSVGAPIAIVPDLGVWNQYGVDWTAEGSATAAIEITFDSTAFGGNDTAFDDLSFLRTSGTCIRPEEIPPGFVAEGLVVGLSVPGNSNPFLAGQPDGAATKSDSAPNESPVEALAVTPGDILIFGATGGTSYQGGNPFSPTDGSSFFPSASALGTAGYTTTITEGPRLGTGLPINTLVGVFLSDNVPVDPAPDSLVYEDGLDFELLTPGLRQIFYIGDGLTGNQEGIRQQFIVPEGATRLFLGSTDGFGWFNNSGQFFVDICRLQNGSTGTVLGPTSIRFDQKNYEAEQGAAVSGSIQVDPLPPGGLYSQGMMITLRSTDGAFVGVLTPEIEPLLDNDGPLAMTSQLTMDPGTGGIKGTAPFATTRRNLFSTSLATFSINDLPVGEYDLGIIPWNQLGPTEDIFVTGLCQTLDPFITFEPSKLNIIGGALPEITLAGGLTLNRQTSLINQAITVTNNTGRAINGFRLFITDLPEGVQLWNAHGIIDGVPYIDIFTTLEAGASLEILLEYYRPSRQLGFTPTFALTEATGVAPGPGASPPLGLDLRVLRLDTRGLLLEFLSENGKSYTIEYSDDMMTWKVSPPAVAGTGERIQWIDSGPPNTETFPSGARFYRILQN